jgi:TrmH family RNA methyltransferase
MISKNQVKQIVSLHQGKFRKLHKQFIAEGPKVVGELLAGSFNVIAVYALNEWNDEGRELARQKQIPVFEITHEELGKISALVTPNLVLAVAANETAVLDWGLLKKSLTLMLDGIRDPGNLGTIIRIADWFGIGQIICSPDCVEVYNPKVIQAAMGSAFRVKVFYQELGAFLEDLPVGLPVFGASLDGKAISGLELPSNGIVMIGSESHGISPDLQSFMTQKLFIPSFQNGSPGTGLAESLNASVATAVMLYEFRRQQTCSDSGDTGCNCHHV